ncbi:nb-arc and tpr domain containing protein [Grosmannia clavigera kw1407]|uniref:Nb-arc and tpr domain containing protein n=1 Tax=Grosmannia clavigera (strain kw1407 / UAMH 11150) TaxID=655863 RepID=F0XPP7_GROCL|nr:nb-arc and tpr domain containing protein [Grosmannia clavigera kw1407]EFX00266.1 nb-arc and tpr domain containing protein [Grosmannia clavigera kw1407]
MVKIDTKGETLFGADKDHMGLCDIDEGEPLYGRVVEFFSAFVQQAPKAVEVALRPAAAQTVRYANANLRTRSSVSSFAMKSSGQNEPAIYTPESTLSNVTSQAPLDLETGAGEILEQQVRLPFSHTGSVTRNRNFYGRIAELEAIDCAFGLTPRPAQEEDEEAEGFATPKTYALSGMAGIGKTEIAIEYLYSRRDRFDAVIWLYADTAQKMGAQFSVLAKELSHVPVPDSVDDVSARDIVRGWLAAPAGHRNEHGQAVQADVGTWLMVLDNAEQPDVLYEWLPDQGPGCILVTSRIPYVKEGAYRLQRGQHLEPFAPSVGGLMLSELSGRGGEAGAVDASRRISDVLGGVPQALFLMSACIREHQLTLADFEQWYEHDPGQLHGFRASMAGPQTAHGSTIATAWAIEKLGKSTVALLRLLSVLDPDRISESMLRGTETEPASAELDVLPPDYPRQAAGYFAARSELLRASLVVRNMATGELRAHRLVLDVVRLQMDHNMLYSTCAAAAVLLSRAWPYVSGTDPDRNQAWRVPEAERYAPHICRLEALLGQAIRDGRYNGTATIGRLLCSYGWHMTERGAPARTEALSSLAQRILQKAVAGGRAGDEDEDEDEERTTHWLGEAHHNLSLAACHTGSSSGARDAEIWQDILRGRIAKYGRPADQLALATAHNQMGICLARQDRYEDALRSFQLSLAGFRACTDPPRFSGTFPAISISLLCLLLRRPGQAEHYLMPTLLEHERHLGPDDTTTTESGHIWRAMGHIRRGQHRFTEALRYHERALTNIRAIVGDKHHFSGDSFYSVAEDLMQIGDLPVAIQNLDCAIEAFTAGPHRDAQAARALWTKGRALRMMGNEQDSGQLFREAIERRHKLVPGDRRSINELSDNDWTSLVFYWSR